MPVQYVMYQIKFLTIVIFYIPGLSCTILDRLQTYEIVASATLRFPRAIDVPEFKNNIRFSTSTTSWCLDLYPENGKLLNEVNVNFISPKGTRNLQFNAQDVVSFRGTLCGVSNSNVNAVLDKSTGYISARISTLSGVYFFEPLSLYTDHSENPSYLFYNSRDIKPLGIKFNCSSDIDEPFQKVPPASHLRPKREANFYDKTLCRLTFVVDYAFYKNVGNIDGPKTIRLIIALFHQLNALYQSAKFLVDEAVEKSGFGFALGDVIIHDSWSPIPGHYNAKTDVDGKPWTPQALSMAFNHATFNRTCLAHLLTYRPFMGVLGRAWTAAPELGGICSPPSKQDGREFHTNTGWTTYSDHSGRRLLNAMAELITAHELGHNWGAAHDPDTAECSPPALSHGKYLMYAHSVGGFAENNFKFSPCSRRTIGATLAARAPLCFISPSESPSERCGNRRLDPGEECDVGAVQGDECCTTQCKLRPLAQCSPWNHDCCTQDCKIAAANTSCTGKTFTNPCLEPSKCDGNSPVCPMPRPKSGVSCAEHGRCVEGKCMPHCAIYGLKTCLCDEPEQSCHICCLFPRLNSTSSMSCRPVILSVEHEFLGQISGRYSLVESPLSVRSSTASSHLVLHLDDYRPCVTGYCKDGKCVVSKQNSILRFWEMSPEEEYETFKSLVENNLVIIVLAISLIIWIPATYALKAYRESRNNFDTEIQLPEKT